MEIIMAIWKHLIKLLILNLILVPFMVLAPAILVVLPLVLIFDNPSGDFSGLAQFFFWTGPLSCAFWMLVSCHWQSVRQWQRMGRLDTWRQDHGGLLRTVAKATFYMFVGLVASFFFEMLFLSVFCLAPYSQFSSASRFALWFVLFPFATFAPVILLWLRYGSDRISSKKDKLRGERRSSGRRASYRSRYGRLSCTDMKFSRSIQVS